MAKVTPETRPPAPGKLRFVQELMNSSHLGHVGLDASLAAEIRERRAAGASQAQIAADFGLSQLLVAAVLRGARLEDDLRSPESCAAWLEQRGLLPSGTTLTVSDAELLRELRELLRSLAQGNNGQDVEPSVNNRLGAIASTAPVVIRFDEPDRPSLEPQGHGVGYAIGGILAIVFEASRDGTFQRLKRCPGTNCPHTFYDSSKNRTGTWCAMSVCGNRTKVRAYQSRRRRPAATRS